MTENDADKLLQNLGCYADKSLSCRVAGRIRDIPIYDGQWFPCTKDTWNVNMKEFEKLIPYETRSVIRNPFITAEIHRLPNGTWKGQHRGWKVLNCIGNELYEQIENTNKKIDISWGFSHEKDSTGKRSKICYKDGILGVFIAYRTGTKKLNSLQAYKSMYKT
jgi:hypothetical protein